VLGAKAPIQPLRVVIEDRLAGCVVVEDAPEDLVILVDPLDDGIEEGAVENEAEVLEVVGACTGGERFVCSPRLLELVEQKLVGVVQFESEALVHHVDDA
jgi:hypothetical protein